MQTNGNEEPDGRTLFSIVVSLYNEEAVVRDFYSELSGVVAGLDYDVEMLFVDDGSTDLSAEIIDSFAEEDARVRAIHLSHNFGHEAAMLAGLDNARGAVAVCMDADLQNPPCLLPNMLAKYKEGFDVVCMKRDDREDGGLYRRLTSKCFYALINRLSDVRIEPNASDFFLVSHRVMGVLRSDFRERARFLRGIIQIVGFPRETLSYKAPQRAAGKSKYSFLKLVHYSVIAIASFTKAPLRLGLYAGCLFGLLCFVLIIYSLVMWLTQQPVGGYTTLIIFLSAFASLLFIELGIIGSYVGFVFDEVKARPIYIIKDEVSQKGKEM